ncbi:MAG: kinase [Pseudomonadota bacterium]|nr:kinase [Pseudomonadota bacterium]
MIISQTPFRISFFGGGTDYPLWFREHGGAVLATTIDKYCYLSCRYLPPFFAHKHRIVYSVIENVKEIEDIKHPAVREVVKYLGIRDGLEVHHDGDLPARSGLGSSSSFTVGLLNTLYALHGKLTSKAQLAKLAIHIEQNIIKETVGSQDQISAAFGGFNIIKFNRDDSFQVDPVIITKERKEELESHLMLFFTGISRTAETVAQSKLKNFEKKTSQLSTMFQMVQEAQSILESSRVSICEIGEMLHEGWLLKQELSDKVSNKFVSDMYTSALESGAIGGKLLGAGGGGFMLLFVPPERQEQVRQRLRGLIEVNFKFENQGSRITLYDPNLGNSVETLKAAASIQLPSPDQLM